MTQFGSNVISIFVEDPNWIICRIGSIIFVRGPKVIYGAYIGNICGSPITLRIFG